MQQIIKLSFLSFISIDETAVLTYARQKSLSYAEAYKKLIRIYAMNDFMKHLDRVIK